MTWEEALKPLEDRTLFNEMESSGRLRPDGCDRVADGVVFDNAIKTLNWLRKLGKEVPNAIRPRSDGSIRIEYETNGFTERFAIDNSRFQTYTAFVNGRSIMKMCTVIEEGEE